MALLHVALPTLLLLAAILVFVEANKSFGEKKKQSITLLGVGGDIKTDDGKEISFNEDQSLDIVIDHVLVAFPEGCVTSWLASGGPGQKSVKVVIAPAVGCKVSTRYTLVVEGRVLSGAKCYNQNFSTRDYVKT